MPTFCIFIQSGLQHPVYINPEKVSSVQSVAASVSEVRLDYGAVISVMGTAEEIVEALSNAYRT